MGARGIPPTPTEILKLRGSQVLRYRKDEPQPEKGRPDDPPNQTPAQKEIFDRLCAALDSINLLATSDGWQLERYCVYLDRWRNIENAIKRLGDDVLKIIIKEDAAALFKLLSAESRKLDLCLKQIELQFGLTPSARARLIVPGKSDPASEKEYFFGVGG